MFFRTENLLRSLGLSWNLSSSDMLAIERLDLSDKIIEFKGKRQGKGYSF